MLMKQQQQDQQQDHNQQQCRYYHRHSLCRGSVLQNIVLREGVERVIVIIIL